MKTLAKTHINLTKYLNRSETIMNKNRYLIMQNLEGVQAQLKAAVEHIDNLFASPSST